MNKILTGRRGYSCHSRHYYTYKGEVDTQRRSSKGGGCSSASASAVPADPALEPPKGSSKS